MRVIRWIANLNPTNANLLNKVGDFVYARGVYVNKVGDSVDEIGNFVYRNGNPVNKVGDFVYFFELLLMKSAKIRRDPAECPRRDFRKFG